MADDDVGMARPALRREPLSWDDLRAFVAVAVHGSMNRAGAALGESQPTVGRRMRRLERALGVALLARGPNAAALTDAGRDLLRAAAPMAENARDVEAAVLPHRPRADAPLKVTSTNTMSLFLSRHLPRLAQAIAPRGFVLLPTRRVLDLAQGEADIALRMRRIPADGNVLVRKLGRIGFAFYGVSDDPALPVIMPANRQTVAGQYAVAVRLAALRPIGPEIDEMHLRYNAVKAGVGIGALPCWLADADPQLMRVHDNRENRVIDELFLVRAARTRGDRDIEALSDAVAALMQAHRKELLG